MPGGTAPVEVAFALERVISFVILFVFCFLQKNLSGYFSQTNSQKKNDQLIYVSKWFIQNLCPVTESVIVFSQ